MRGVIETKPGGSRTYSMRLLKREVGQFAQLLLGGDALGAAAALSVPPAASVRSFRGPEREREAVRRTDLVDRRQLAHVLESIRTNR